MKAVRAAAVMALMGALLEPASPASAQAAGESVVATIEVVAPPVEMEGFRNLQFGNVVPGDTIRVPALNPPAGTVSGAVRFSNLHRQRTYTVTFSLPPVLARGTSQIPVRWNHLDFGYLCVWRNEGACDPRSKAFDPTVTLLIPPAPAGTGGTDFTGDLSIGGELRVPAGIAPGVYRGTITATLAVIS